MSCISRARENIIMEVPKKNTDLKFSATLAYNGNFIKVFFKAPALECIFYDSWSLDIFFGTSSIYLNILNSCFTNLL